MLVGGEGSGRKIYKLQFKMYKLRLLAEMKREDLRPKQDCARKRMWPDQ